MADVCLGVHMVFICALARVLVPPHPLIHLLDHRGLFKMCPVPRDARGDLFELLCYFNVIN